MKKRAEIRRARDRCFDSASGGFSIVELMIALVLGALLLEGMAVLLSKTHGANATRDALSRLQERGRTALDLIASDLRNAGRMPCGSPVRPLVYADAVAAHAGLDPAAAAPAGWPEDAPYALGHDVFIAGKRCTGNACAPEIGPARNFPDGSVADGEHMAGGDVLTLRYVEGDGMPVQVACARLGQPTAMTIRDAPGASSLAAFDVSHLALLASCPSSEVFAVARNGDGLHVPAGIRGEAVCPTPGAQARLFDFDTQLRTIVYFLRSREGERTTALVRRENGVDREVVQGVERLDFRYSLVDRNGIAYWLAATEVTQARTHGGEPLQCADAPKTSARPCSWSDVTAVDVSMLIGLPRGGSNVASDPTESDRDGPAHAAQVPSATNVPSKSMLQREFHTVVALRSLGA